VFLLVPAHSGSPGQRTVKGLLFQHKYGCMRDDMWGGNYARPAAQGLKRRGRRWGSLGQADSKPPPHQPQSLGERCKLLRRGLGGTPAQIDLYALFGTICR